MRTKTALFFLNRRNGGKRFTLALLAAALGAMGFALAEPQRKPGRVGGTSIDVAAEPLAGFDKARPEQRKFGKLEWRGGLVLSSPLKDFGGWSGLALDAAGMTLVAVSDGGHWMTAEIRDDGQRLLGLRSTKLGPILAANGKPVFKRRDIDAESIRFAEPSSGQGQVYIGFERNHRIAVADAGEKGVGAPRRFIPLPPDTKRMARNEGLEAVAILQAGPAKGSLVAIAEHLPDGKGRHTGWLWAKGKPKAFFLTNPGDFSATDAVGLADGGLVLLERRYRFLEGVRMRVRHIAAGDIRPGAVLEGNVLIEADQRQEIDNMEGFAVHEAPGGETVLTLISDNNFNPALQRTLLLRFTWNREGLAKAD